MAQPRFQCRRIWLWRGLAGAALGALPALAWAQDEPVMPQQIAAASRDLTQLSLNELLNIEVTSVAKHAEPLADSPAAVYVLTGDEIRRSGAHSIAEALRLVPGLDVAQVSAEQYAISARGFSGVGGTSSDKLLVLVDGRSVYTPLASSVFWDVLDTYLPDLDRIEVIRGPGAALWGANAVNGVINIITKSARDTLGLSAQAAGGNVERMSGGARAGFVAGENGALRIYATGHQISASARPDGGDGVDGMRLEQTGFRGDWALPHHQSLTVSGDAYTGRERTDNISGSGTADTTLTGGNVLGRWGGHTIGNSDWSLQAYYDNYSRKVPGVYAETRNTLDLDFQQGFRIGAHHRLLYGVGYRNSHDDTAGVPNAILFDPPRLTLQTGSAFVQDQIALAEALELTLGSKFEYDTFTGFEAEPSVRLGWRATPQTFAWAAVSRAVRLPNRLDEDIAVYCPPPAGYPGVCGPGLFRVGNPHFDSEKLIAYEWGLRHGIGQDFSAELSVYYNDYTDLRSTEVTQPFVSFANNVHAHSYGGELSAVWSPRAGIEVRPYYAFFHIEAETRAGSLDRTTVAALEGSDPRHQLGLRVGWQPHSRWQSDVDLRYVDKRPARQVPDYAELDLRVAYLLAPHLELALTGRNLLHDRHPEWSNGAASLEPRRSGTLELSWGVR